MSALLAAAVFAVVAILQLIRAVQRWNVVIATTTKPVSASWVAFVVAGTLALLGYNAART
jgi:hypothetical protein